MSQELLKNIADVSMVGGMFGVIMDVLPDVTIVLLFLIAAMRLVNEVSAWFDRRKQRKENARLDSPDEKLSER
jgi:uncharacterized membrane protein